MLNLANAVSLLSSEAIQITSAIKKKINLANLSAFLPKESDIGSRVTFQ
jgi:hypothetical protein